MTDKTLGAYERRNDETENEARARIQAMFLQMLEEADAALAADMDGGVTAAAIEKEAEGLTAADFAKAEFARHPDGRRAVRLIDSEDFMAFTVFGGVKFIGASKMAEHYWSPVRECPDKDVHWRYDEAQEAIHRLTEERDEARAAEPRPLTPDDITDEMVERGWAWASRHELYGSGSVRILLEEALTVPTRPEGAEELGRLIDSQFNGDEGIYADDLADFLASRGVRVEGSGR